MKHENEEIEMTKGKCHKCDGNGKVNFSGYRPTQYESYIIECLSCGFKTDEFNSNDYMTPRVEAESAFMGIQCVAKPDGKSLPEVDANCYGPESKPIMKNWLIRVYEKISRKVK